MPSGTSEIQHAALWLVGPDMPGLLSIGARFVADHGGNIDKDIADKFGENVVVFMSITAQPSDIARMAAATTSLKEASGCTVVFQPMREPTIPDGYQEGMYGFDVITDDAVGIVADLTHLLGSFGMLIVGHTGERRMAPGPRRQMEAGQRFVVLLPQDFDHGDFNHQMTELVKRYNGQMKTPLRPVLGLLWW